MTLLLIFLIAAAWLLLAVIAGPVLDNPRKHEDGLTGGVLLAFTRLLMRTMHRPVYSGLEHIEAAAEHVESGERPVIVVANHTAGIDPLLVQVTTSRFEIRWMMAADMRAPILESFWKWARIIDVDRVVGGDAGSAREALRHLKNTPPDCVLGIFPEGGIERPACELLPFQPGVGLLIKRSRAMVLPVIIEGTPQVDPAFASLWHTSRSRVRFLPLIDYSKSKLKPLEILADLQQRYVDETGWPINRDKTSHLSAGSEAETPAAARSESQAASATAS